MTSDVIYRTIFNLLRFPIVYRNISMFCYGIPQWRYSSKVSYSIQNEMKCVLQETSKVFLQFSVPGLPKYTGSSLTYPVQDTESVLRFHVVQNEDFLAYLWYTGLLLRPVVVYSFLIYNNRSQKQSCILQVIHLILYEVVYYKTSDFYRYIERSSISCCI